MGISWPFCFLSQKDILLSQLVTWGVFKIFTRTTSIYKLCNELKKSICGSEICCISHVTPKKQWRNASVHNTNCIFFFAFRKIVFLSRFIRLLGVRVSKFLPLSFPTSFLLEGDLLLIQALSSWIISWPL